MKINCSKKEEWANFMMRATNLELKNEIEIRLDDKDQLSNLFYLLPVIDKMNYNMPLVHLVGEADLLYEADALLFLSNQRRIAFPEGYKRKQHLQFDISLPFLKFNRDNLKDLNTIWEESNLSETINYKKIKGEGNEIDFIKLYIQEKLNKWKELENKNKYETLKTAFKEMNLLSLFLFVYQIKDLSDEIQGCELNDLKQVIKQLSVGIYEIIENSCIHSLCKHSYFSLSNINFKNVNPLKIESYIKTNKNKLNKKVSFLENFNFQLEDDKYIFVRLMDDTIKLMDFPNSSTKKIIQQTLIRNLKNKKLIDEEYNLGIFFEKLYKNEAVYNQRSVSNEYGLITFLSSAETLNMQFLANSGDDVFLFTNHIGNGTSYKFIKDCKCRINNAATEYSCIIPVKPLSKSNKSISTSATNLTFLDKQDFETISLQLTEKEVKDFYLKKIEKSTIIENTFSKWEKIYVNPNRQIFKINIELDQIEFLVKILSKQIERSLYYGWPTYIILNFCENERGALSYKISKFFQYYKVAIRKLLLQILDGNFLLENNKKLLLKNIDHNKFQFAFYHTKERKTYYVSTMVGINWDSIVLSFISNILYNNELSLENYFDLYLDQIKFNNTMQLNEIKILPFDFYIRGGSGKNQFIESLVDFCQNKTVMHQNVNVLLESGLYLKHFYAAEHLFMNRYCVKKIALLIKQDLDKQLILNKNKKIMLVSYGNYSHFLCEEVRKLLNCEKLPIPHTGILELQTDENTKNIKYENYDFIGILPIGSTLFSYYKMNAYLRKYFKIADKKLLLKNNYSILVVAPKDNKFWTIKEDPDNSFNVLELNQKISTDENPLVEDPMKVRYMIRLDPEWSEEVGKELAVTHVDKTSTIPNSIYQIENAKSKDIITEKEITKFTFLKKAVEYGHFSLNHNHYLFYINSSSFLENASDEQNKKIIIEELSEQNKKIDPLAYNIIISPLNDTNNDFLEAIIKYVFANKVSILQFDLYNTYRDNFINKNYNILENIDHILRVSSNTKVNIYFVDNTIISAKTIKRAKELMHALLKETRLLKDTSFSTVFDRFPKRLFEKAFILINRCSDNTLETIMDNRENVYSFIDINCPHFDTVGDCCPDCNISSNYKYLADFTSNETLRKQLLDVSYSHRIKIIKPNYMLNYTPEALARLCFTHFILKEIKSIHWHKDYYVDIVSKLYDDALDFVSKVVTLENKLKYKILFVKTISRPLISAYELMKQAGFAYLKYELEELIKTMFLDEIPNKYFLTLIQRISYYGTSYLRDNREILLEYKIDKNVLDRALLWEEAYSRGIIK